LAFTTAEGRARLLDDTARAIEQLSSAVAELSEAFEQLDDSSAERLEELLFRPIQHAYGRALRGRAQFAARHGLDAAPPAEAPASAPAGGAHLLIERAVGHVQLADSTLGELQDSLLPIEVGDEELRADLTGVRAGIDHVPARARELLRTLGR